MYTKLVRPFNEQGKKTIVFMDMGIKQEGQTNLLRPEWNHADSVHITKFFFVK